MAERKVLNKYYSPDFDPEEFRKLSKQFKRPRPQQVTIRIMMPMTVICNRCHEAIHRGKKFNARKEEAAGEAYLNIKVWRFYFRCPTCSAVIAFKTDPRNADYQVESGATRNFEPFKDQMVARVNELMAADRGEQIDRGDDTEGAGDSTDTKPIEEENDPMKELERKREDTKREMERNEQIEELLDLHQQHNQLNVDEVIQFHSLHTQKVSEEKSAHIAEEQLEKREREHFRRLKENIRNGGKLELEADIELDEPVQADEQEDDEAGEQKGKQKKLVNTNEQQHREENSLAKKEDEAEKKISQTTNFFSNNSSSSLLNLSSPAASAGPAKSDAFGLSSLLSSSSIFAAPSFMSSASSISSSSSSSSLLNSTLASAWRSAAEDERKRQKKEKKKEKKEKKKQKKEKKKKQESSQTEKKKEQEVDFEDSADEEDGDEK